VSADLRDLHATLLLELERPVDALQGIERAIDAGGRAPFRLRVLAGARSKVGDFQGAMDAASEAAARAPSDVAGQLLLFESALRADDTAAALHAARTASSSPPTSRPRWSPSPASLEPRGGTRTRSRPSNTPSPSHPPTRLSEPRSATPTVGRGPRAMRMPRGRPSSRTRRSGTPPTRSFAPSAAFTSLGG
jgi:hypothetical protein